jgi:hypothetical protein
VGDMRNSCKILVGKSEGKKSVGRHSHRLEDNIIMYLKKVGCRLNSSGLG